MLEPDVATQHTNPTTTHHHFFMLQVVTTNRELERGATEAESALASLREATQRELTDLRETHDRQVTLNAEEQAAVDAHVKRKAELDGALVAARASLADLTMEAESTQKKAVEGEKRVREVGEAMRAEVERREKAMGEAKAAEAEARKTVDAARAHVDQAQVYQLFFVLRCAFR